MGPLGYPELVILVMIPLMIACLALWVWSLVDCITNEPSEGNDKVVWILVIVLAGWIGSLVYIFARRPVRKRELGR